MGAHQAKKASQPSSNFVTTFSKAFHCVFLTFAKWYGYTPLFLLVSLVVFVVHFDISLRVYKRLSSTTEPRRSSVDRSRNFPGVPRSRLYGRHNRPWYKYADLRPSAVRHVLSAEDSRYRFLVSTAPDELDEAIASRFLVLNFERLVADMLNVTFIDRHHGHGSLTRTDKYAVENFFGWNSPDFFDLICKRQRTVLAHGNCHERLVVCAKLHPHNPFVDSIVAVPADIALCARRPHTPKCRRAVAAFTRLHHWQRTLFHMPTSLCQAQLAWPDVRATRGWHFSRYWQQARAAALDPRYVNIAVHVARAEGVSGGARRASGDAAYAAVIAHAIDVVRASERAALAATNGAARMRTVFRVHVYSEGRARPRAWHPVVQWMVRRGVFGRDVNDFGTAYVGDDGAARANGYWEGLLAKVSGRTRRDTKVDLHVSEDVLEGLEQMIAADVFVGSASALSVHLVGLLSRGIVLLPVRGARALSSNQSVGWNADGGYGAWAALHADDTAYFDKLAFADVWRGYRKHIGANMLPLGLPA